MRRARQTRRHQSRERDESGSSLVEMLVAAGLTVTALGVLLGNVVVPLQHLVRAHEPDAAGVELRVAGEEVARLVRAARPGILEPAVVADGEQAVVLRLQDDGHVHHVRVALNADALEIERWDVSGASVAGSRRTLVSGLVPGAGGIEVHHDPFAAVPGPADVAAVRMHLVSEGASLDRTFALRLSSHLDGAGGW